MTSSLLDSLTPPAPPRVGADDAGRAAPFADAYRELYRPMVQLAYLTTGSNALAEEIVQDAFVELYRRWHTVREPRAYLRQAVVNGCTSWVRRRRHERHVGEADSVAPTDPDVLAVRAALADLNPRQRAAVVLRYFEDLPEAEIARVLGCRPGTVKSTLSRSLDKLKETLS